jgi:hypothetical protein
MQTWESAAQTAFDASEPYTLECFGDYASGLNENVTIDGWTQPTPTNNLTIKAAAGEEHNGVLGAGFYLTQVGGASVCMAPYLDNMVIQDIGFLKTNNGVVALLTKFSAQDNLLVERCWGIETANNSTTQILRFRNLTNSVVRNCIALYGGNACFIVGENVTALSVENCTAVGQSTHSVPTVDGFTVSTQTTLKNCVAITTTGDDYNGTANAASTNNASEDITAPGANPVTGILTTDFVSYTDDITGDYTPASGGNLDGAGADLSGDFTDDITGATRSVPWEIGAYEIAAAALTFSLSPDSGPLPAGLSVNATTGNIEGTPTESGTFPNIIIRGSE